MRRSSMPFYWKIWFNFSIHVRQTESEYLNWSDFRVNFIDLLECLQVHCENNKVLKYALKSLPSSYFPEHDVFSHSFFFISTLRDNKVVEQVSYFPFPLQHTLVDRMSYDKADKRINQCKRCGHKFDSHFLGHVFAATFFFVSTVCRSRLTKMTVKYWTEFIALWYVNSTLVCAKQPICVLVLPQYFSSPSNAH